MLLLREVDHRAEPLASLAVVIEYGLRDRLEMADRLIGTHRAIAAKVLRASRIESILLPGRQ